MTDDRFVLLIAQSDAAFDVSTATAYLQNYDMVQMRELIDDGCSHETESTERRAGRDLACRDDDGHRHPARLRTAELDLAPTMKTSPAVHAFEVQPHFPNGRTLQPAVAGTIARGHLPLHFTATKEDAVRAGEELRNPYQQPIAAAGTPADAVTLQAELAASVLRGEGVYRIYCIACHGASGAWRWSRGSTRFPATTAIDIGKICSDEGRPIVSHPDIWSGETCPRWRLSLITTMAPDAVNYVRACRVKPRWRRRHPPHRLLLRCSHDQYERAY